MLIDGVVYNSHGYNFQASILCKHYLLLYMPRDVGKELSTRVEALRKLEAVAKDDPGWTDSDFDFWPSDTYKEYLAAKQELRLWFYHMDDLDEWLAVSAWCADNDGVFGEALEEPHTPWNERSFSVDKALLISLRDRLRMRPVQPEYERIWTDPRMVDLMVDTDWFMPSLLTRDDELLQTLHLLGVPEARAKLSDIQLDIVKYMDELRSYFTVNGFRIFEDQKKVGYEVEFDNNMPYGHNVGMSVFYYRDERAPEVTSLPSVDVTCKEEGKFTVGTLDSAGGVHKGTSSVTAFRKKGGWKSWREEMGTKMVLYMYTSCLIESYKKERFGDRWYYLPTPGFFAAVAETPGV